MAARPLATAALGLVGLSTLYLSLVAGASPILLGIGVLALDIGVAFAMTVITNAAAGTLAPRQMGTGMGILQASQFIGAGAGPALMGALLAGRQGAEAINPVYRLPAPAYSDVFGVITLVVVLAIGAAMLLSRVR